MREKEPGRESAPLSRRLRLTRWTDLAFGSSYQAGQCYVHSPIVGSPGFAIAR